MIIGGFHPLSLCDFPETPAAVIFLQGCNWRCRYCHNKQLIPKRPQGEPLDFEEILKQLKTRRKILQGVVLTGGEPTLHKGLPRVIRQLKELGLRVKLDSNGSNPSILQTLIAERILDYIAMDIKAPFDKYELITNCPIERKLIEESIHLIATSGIPHQFRTTWPKELLSAADIAEIRSMLPENSEYVLQECRA